MRTGLLASCVLGCWTVAGALAAEPRRNVTVDFAKPAGRIKPLNGVCNGPYAYGENAKLEGYHAEAAFPFTRLHDVHWPYSDAVDVSTIFPIFAADPDDPQNYTFAKTDDYLAAIVKNRSQIVYRLGESIEPWTRYHNHPPKDFAKWARICVNIIRHYNEGWAGGFRTVSSTGRSGTSRRAASCGPAPGNSTSSCTRPRPRRSRPMTRRYGWAGRRPPTPRASWSSRSWPSAATGDYRWISSPGTPTTAFPSTWPTMPPRFAKCSTSTASGRPRAI